MDYTVDKEQLRGRITEEVARVADAAYAEDGTSLYDTIALTSRDTDTVDRHIEDAVSVLVLRAVDICTLSQDGETLHMDVPDFDTALAGMVSAEITRYITLRVCAALFHERRPQSVEAYAQRAQAALDKAVRLLKSRKSLS